MPTGPVYLKSSVQGTLPHFYAPWDFDFNQWDKDRIRNLPQFIELEIEVATKNTIFLTVKKRRPVIFFCFESVSQISEHKSQ